VIVPVYLREKKGGSMTYSPSHLFGQPLLIGLPRDNLTYETLYERVLGNLSRYVNPPPEGMEWWKNNENDAVNGTGEDSKPSMAADPSEDSNSPVSEENQSPDSENDTCNNMDFLEEDDMKGPPKLFALNLVNSYGNSQIIELVNDGTPLKIKCSQLFANNNQASVEFLFC
jgi:hypothetical protein